MRKRPMPPSTDSPTGVPCHTRDDLERRLLRKLDLRTMSIIVVMSALNSIDQTNVSNARLAGYEADLHLEGNQYATILSIAYVGFIVMQLPANMLLHWMQRPAVFLPSCMVAWGVISVLTGITKNYTAAFVTRFFLGFVEAPFTPGVLFLISGWYKRDEIALRTSIVLCGTLLSTVFGSVLASSIVLTSMQGVLGLAAWRWLFYITGSITILAAICAVFILPDFPHNTRWLTPEERALAVSRLAEDNELEKRTTVQGLWDAVSDWKVWWFSVAFVIQCIAQSFFIYFPTLVFTLGYNLKQTLLLCTPPWVFAVIIALALSKHSDKAQRRYIYIFASNAIAVIGVVISMCTMNTAARYISLFLMAQVIGGGMVLWAWINNTFAREPAKRAAAIALINGLSQVGNMIGSFVWPSNWGPTYRYSYGVCFAALGVSTSMFGVLHLYLKYVNKQIEKNERDAKDVNELRVPIGFRYLV
ncbi:major facilitator superfamily domain-containing protein [Suillus paluster]|uniref:major facilitator superfamily domain-containing protein n=1 Tax=Suillus paluster TaxID=48578 RepID=UPI001B85E78E|nr:major facilitator superfamily domain-containing protein [Suillus paluster]KAG1729529.1 major facilitator superfamily domain-containing protein [Suillus paluster]